MPGPHGVGERLDLVGMLAEVPKCYRPELRRPGRPPVLVLEAGPELLEEHPGSRGATQLDLLFLGKQGMLARALQVDAHRVRTLERDVLPLVTHEGVGEGLGDSYLFVYCYSHF